MSGQTSSDSSEPAPRSRTGTYVAVLVLEAAVIAALWLFGRYFSM
jgi:hypothetical protein